MVFYSFTGELRCRSPTSFLIFYRRTSSKKIRRLKAMYYDVEASAKRIKDLRISKGLTQIEAAEQMGFSLSGYRKLEQGLLFVNLVDFDMLYGHRRDVDGYAEALSDFDRSLPLLLSKMREDDVLMLTADHGCDPAYTATTDHTREYTPFLMYGSRIRGRNLGTRKTFADIGATVLQYFGITPAFSGEGMLEDIE